MARQLEKPPRGSTKPRNDTAKLTLNNAELPEGLRYGVSLVAAGVSPVVLALMDAKAAQGKFDWWRKLSPYKQALFFVPIMLAAGFFGRQWRRQGQFKKAVGAEALAISAYTLMVNRLALALASKKDRGEAAGLGALASKNVEDMSADELKALEDRIDEDIRLAAANMRAAAERGELDVDDDMGALEIHGDPGIFVDDDDEF